MYYDYSESFEQSWRPDREISVSAKWKILHESKKTEYLDKEQVYLHARWLILFLKRPP